MYWFEYSGPEKDVFISSRVRLARNIVDYPFGDALDKTGADEIAQRVKNALSKDEGYTYTDFSALAENEKAAYVEKSIASPDMLGTKLSSAIVENKEKGISVLVGEEDHIRIQAIRSGFDIQGAADAAFDAEALIDEKERIAFSKELGYLTHCPTNLGTGMRASVMMFLPMLTATGRTRGLDASLQKIGLTVRGVNGEGSQAKGCLYQISNRITMGITEEETIQRLCEAANALAGQERELRERAKGADIVLEDRIMRAFGTMKYARVVDTEELYKLYSDVRLGICLGYIDKSLEEIDRLKIACMPGELSVSAGRALSPMERDIQRAKKLASF